MAATAACNRDLYVAYIPDVQSAAFRWSSGGEINIRQISVGNQETLRSLWTRPALEGILRVTPNGNRFAVGRRRWLGGIPAATQRPSTPRTQALPTQWPPIAWAASTLRPRNLNATSQGGAAAPTREPIFLSERPACGASGRSRKKTAAWNRVGSTLIQRPCIPRRHAAMAQSRVQDAGPPPSP